MHADIRYIHLLLPSSFYTRYRKNEPLETLVKAYRILPIAADADRRIPPPLVAEHSRCTPAPVVSLRRCRNQIYRTWVWGWIFLAELKGNSHLQF
ncbi:hypothetical protein GUJ93_ZPchr0013g34867 [Zizania palustris]|uniref:Uncharacterized protein n=1 Tax=Zizania palustris TaxID=103762 RepID=A0A8J6BZU0_ZIZPA|nr:hypothetical protein GUJ93_ZPchr0013g34867 [Zizania palustris]